MGGAVALLRGFDPIAFGVSCGDGSGTVSDQRGEVDFRFDCAFDFSFDFSFDISLDFSVDFSVDFSFDISLGFGVGVGSGGGRRSGFACVDDLGAGFFSGRGRADFGRGSGSGFDRGGGS